LYLKIILKVNRYTKSKYIKISELKKNPKLTCKTRNSCFLK